MKNSLKLAAIISLALLSNFALYSVAPITQRQVVQRKSASKPSKPAKNYKAEFLDLYGKDLKACSLAKRQLIRALVESDMVTLKKFINPQNVNNVFEVRSLDTVQVCSSKIPLKKSLIKIPYIWIAAEAYYEAPNKKVKEQALLIIKELLKLGANPNKARTVFLAGQNVAKGKIASIEVRIPTMFCPATYEDPVLFELFLQHKGNLNAAIVAPSGRLTVAEQVKHAKNPKMKAIMHKYASK